MSKDKNDNIEQYSISLINKGQAILHIPNALFRFNNMLRHSLLKKNSVLVGTQFGKVLTLLFENPCVVLTPATELEASNELFQIFFSSVLLTEMSSRHLSSGLCLVLQSNGEEPS